MASSVGSSSSQSRSRPVLPADAASSDSSDVPVEKLVEYLLDAKRSLSSMTLVLRANELETDARRLHEESVVLSAQTAFLHRGIGDQMRVLHTIRRGMQRAYDAGRREFTQVIKTLDDANGRLEQTMAILRKTVVESVFRPPGEETRKSLMDFVDEKTVDGVHDALKESIAELQAAQTSFDGDMLRLDDDLRLLNKTLSASPSMPSPSSSGAYLPIPHLLAELTNNSHAMAEHLTSLNRHFDMCVTAVRTTEGGAALALRKAAEGEGGEVSISGVIGPADEPTGTGEAQIPLLDNLTPEERAEIVSVVRNDAPEVDEVIAELHAILAQMEADFLSLSDQAGRVRARFLAAVATFHALEDVATRLAGYAAAEAEFVARWRDEREGIRERLAEMDQLRRFYEGYASAYDSLLLEVERRRSVEDKVAATWLKARDAVEKLVEADRREREVFRQEIGDFLPTDLWVGMNAPLTRWQVVPTDEGAAAGESSGNLRESKRGVDAVSGLGKGAVDAGRERKGKGSTSSGVR